DRLLGRTIVFEDAGQAVAFIDSDQGREFDAVSMTGVYFCRNKGIYFSGSPGEEVSLLGRAEEIKKMSASISSLAGQVAEEERLYDDEKNEKAALREKLAGLDGSISEARDELASNQEEMRTVERDHIMKKEKCSLLMKSMDEIESARVETLSKLEEARLALAMQQDTGDVSRVGGLEGELAVLQKEKAGLETALTEKKVELASLQGILDKHREEIRGLGEMQKQFESIVSQRSEEIETAKAEAESLGVTIEEERVVVGTYAEEERGFQKEIDELTGLLEEKRSAISAMESDLRKRQQARDEIFNRINEVKIKLTTIDTKIGDMVERGNELYGEDLGCYLEGREIPLTEEELTVTQEMLDNEKRKLESLGPVNLAAIEEYDEKKERLDFLEAQKEDLVKAKQELEEAITRINKRARKLFLETFQVVKGYFSEIFEVLFEGGEASLTLSEGSDPLEADIIISARPKGKRLQDISLLSGGERALTAISLLFALYKAKPSPFCIFDEVDAPLDDANIQRFVRML
ncbi:MAG TPA: hypothetical protein VLA34_01465, partial [Candidatus Krumholzibacterium sp.]|nr:hypothetical protein [Candidatus Krumholzibacterium sp.]